MSILAGELAACVELYLGGRDHGGALIVWLAIIGLMLMAVTVPVGKGAISNPPHDLDSEGETA